MAISISDVTGAIVARVEATFGALVTRLAPQECITWTSLAETTGLVTGIAAGAPLFSLRNAGSRIVICRRFQIAWLTTTLGAAGRFDFALSVARTFPANDTGGAEIVPARHRGALLPHTYHPRVATTSALTAGAGRVVDGGKVGVAGYWSAAIGSALPWTPLLSHDAGDHPVVLAPNEGLVLSVPSVPAATAVSIGYVNAEVLEVASYP